MSIHRKVGERFDKEASGFDGIYSGEKSYMGRFWDNIIRKNILHRFDYTMNVLEPFHGKSVFDAGCGSGRFCIEYARRGASRVVGVDLASAMLDIANRLSEEEGISDRCEFVLKDIVEYEPDEPFDVVTAMGFFDYIPDPGAILLHLCKLMKDSGIMVASFPALWAFRTPFRKLWRMKDDCFIRFYTQSQVQKYCKHAGLEIKELVRQGPNHLLVASPLAASYRIGSCARRTCH